MSVSPFFKLNAAAPSAKAEALAESVSELRAGRDASRAVLTSTHEFASIPGSPFAYWVDDRLRAIFRSGSKLESGTLGARVGLQTSDDFRFLRTWWEVSPASLAYTRSEASANTAWVHFGKGGSFSRFYADVHLVLGWARDGRELKAWITSLLGGSESWSKRLQNLEWMFHEAITWSRRTQAGLSMRVLPRGCAFSDKGPVIRAEASHAFSILAIVNSALFKALVSSQMAFGSYEVGVVQRTPIPRTVPQGDPWDVATLYEQIRQLGSVDETSHVYAPPHLVGWSSDSTLHGDYQRHLQQRSEIQAAVERRSAELDQRIASAYGLSGDINNAVSSVAETPEGRESEGDGVIGEDDVDEDAGWAAGERACFAVSDLLSWCVGVTFGRWDVRMARDATLIPALQSPFDRLPRVAPGGLVGPDGLPATEQAIAAERWLRARPDVNTLPPPDSFAGPAAIPAAEYPVPVAWDGVLVDDEGHPRDVIGAMRCVLAHVYGDRADAIEAEALALLRGEDGSTPRTMRDWFRNARAAALGKTFFDYHIGRYSKSRRKAPIYWRLAAAPNAPYAVWLYYPRLTPDTLWRVLGDYVTPRRVLAERQLTEAKAARDAAPAGPARRRAEQAVADAVALLESVQALEAELRRVAERGYAPDLDDGVVISAAPLHRVIPWKEPVAMWKRLEAGEYDWAKQAMAFWPERVRAKCETDRSLAIAHGLA